MITTSRGCPTVRRVFARLVVAALLALTAVLTTAVPASAADVPIGNRSRVQTVSCAIRIALPNGSRSPKSVPYGRSVGSSVSSTPRALSVS